MNLIILELTENKDEVNIICPTNHYSNATFDPNKANIIIVKYEMYYEPLYTYLNTSKRNIVSTVLFSSVNSIKDKEPFNIPDLKDEKHVYFDNIRSTHSRTYSAYQINK